MDFCIECGHKRENNEQKFCTNCGVSFSASEETQNTVSDVKVAPVKVKKEMTKGQKRKLVIGSAILILLLAVYFIGDYFTSETRLITKYSDAIQEKDAAKLGGMISFSNFDEKIGEDNAKAFLSLLDEYPDDSQEIIEHLQIQSNHDQYATASEWIAEDYIVSLAKGDGFLFYDTYELVMEPIYVSLYTNVKDAKLFVGDEEIAISDSTDFNYEHGPIVAGNYNFRAEIENEYVDLETVEEATIRHWNHDESIYLTMDATYIEFEVGDLGELDARLIVNDHAVEFNFLEEGEFGPILAEETKVAAEVDFPWGTMTSEADYPYQYYPLIFSLTEDMQTEISEVITDFHQKYWKGWQGNNTSEFSGLSTDLVNKIENEFSYYHNDDYNSFERQHISAEIDKQNIAITYDDGDYILLVSMMEEYAEDWYSDPDYKQLVDNTSFYQIELRYEDGWKIYDINEDYYYSIEDPLKLKLSDDLYVINAKDNKEEQVDEEESSDNDLEVQNSVLNYIEYLVEAINEGNYEVVEPYIKEGSALHGMQVDLVDRLFENGTTQEVVAASVEKINDNGSDWTVTTNETIKIIYESGKEETKSYVWIYTVEAEGSEFVLTNIEGSD